MKQLVELATKIVVRGLKLDFWKIPGGSKMDRQIIGKLFLYFSTT